MISRVSVKGFTPSAASTKKEITISFVLVCTLLYSPIFWKLSPWMFYVIPTLLPEIAPKYSWW